MKTGKSFINSTLAAAALTAGLGLAAGSAQADVFGDFTVDQTSIATGDTPTLLGLGIGTDTFVADKVTGFYNEVLTINPSDGTFVTNAYAYMNAFSANEGTAQAVGSVAGTGYNIYALFTSTGTYNSSTNIFTGLTGELQLYLDPLLNTTLGLGSSGSDPIVAGSNSDDYLLATATSLSYSTGNNVEPGSYKLIWDDFTLEVPAGSEFFIAPDPFYLVVEVTGDFDRFDVVADPSTGLATVQPTGDVSAVFRVPEPGTLALLGLAALGLGVGTRRRSN